ncbi:Noc2p family-domain-containing protein [Tribonema minus]|uniref:Noc2p family-domain-containing protein n=1 Tax=Tribonema minus TaxID=303371 RepID=A0A835ZBW6_9STRA|nr:Noc2p family-domain-containing protein [Tribonema minus]
MGKPASKRTKKFQKKGGLGGIQKNLDKKKQVKAIKRKQAVRAQTREEKASEAERTSAAAGAAAAAQRGAASQAPPLPAAVDLDEFMECRSLYAAVEVGGSGAEEYSVEIDFAGLEEALGARQRKKKRAKPGAPAADAAAAELTVEGVDKLLARVAADSGGAAAAAAAPLTWLAHAFRAAVLGGDAAAADALPAALRGARGSAAAAHLIGACLDALPAAFAAQLLPQADAAAAADGGDGEAAAAGVRAASRSAFLQRHAKMPRSEAWPRLAGALRAFLEAAPHALLSAAGAATAEVAAKAEAAARAAAPLMIPFPELARAALRSAADALAAARSAAAAARAAAVLRAVALSQPLPLFHTALRAAYRAYRLAVERLDGSSGSGGGGAAAVATMAALRTGVAELYRHEPAASQLHAFVFLHTMAATVEAAEEGGKAGEAATVEVRSWPFLQCVLLWTRVVAAGCSSGGGGGGTGGGGGGSGSEAPMAPLVAPLAQIIERAARVAPGAPSLPHRLALARAAQDLAAAAGVFLPAAWMAMGALEVDSLYAVRSAAAAAAAPNGSGGSGGGGGFALAAVARLSRDELRDAAAQRALLAEAAALLAREAALYAQSPAHPDYAGRCARALTAAAARLTGGGGGGGRADVAAAMRAAAEAIERRARDVERARSRLSTHPANVTALEALRPIDGAPAAARLALLDARAGGGSGGGSGGQKKQKGKAGAPPARALRQ